MTTPDFNPQPGQYGGQGGYPPAGVSSPADCCVRWVARVIDGILVAIVS